MIAILQKLGLSEKEAKVYLAILELGRATAGKIIQKSRLPRPTVYLILNSLAEKGIIESSQKGKIMQFVAKPPYQLEIFLSKQENMIKEQREELKKILPELNAIYNLAIEKPRVRFFEGKEGIVLMEEELINNSIGQEILAFSPLDEVYKLFPEYQKNYIDQRIKLKIPLRVIYTRKAGPLKGVTSKAAYRVARFVPKNKFPFTSGIVAYGKDQLALTSYKIDKPFGVIIENQEIYKSFRAFFELAWVGAKRFNVV